MDLGRIDAIRVSDRAQAKLRSLTRSRRAESAAVRLYAERNAKGAVEMGLSLDGRRAEDCLVLADGLELLADPATLRTVGSVYIDYENTGFVISPAACEKAGLPQ